MKNKQMTLAGTGFEKFSKTTRRAEFLAEMDRVVPWAKLCALVEPVYPKGEGGRPAVPLERMMRIYFLQQWFNLSDPMKASPRPSRPKTSSASRHRCCALMPWVRWSAPRIRGRSSCGGLIGEGAALTPNLYGCRQYSVPGADAA